MRKLLILICLSLTVSCVKVSKNTNDNVDTVDSALCEISQIEDSCLIQLDTIDWNYVHEKDEMSDMMIYWASLSSDNLEYFDFPYDGGSQLYLCIRKHPKYGTDVYIYITQGQLLCSDYNGTNYITVRFDGSPAKKYNTVEPADYSSNQLFLIGARDFITRAKKAKTIKIQVPVFNEGDRVFTFTTEQTLKWNH